MIIAKKTALAGVLVGLGVVLMVVSVFGLPLSFGEKANTLVGPQIVLAQEETSPIGDGSTSGDIQTLTVAKDICTNAKPHPCAGVKFGDRGNCEAGRVCSGGDPTDNNSKTPVSTICSCIIKSGQ